MGLKGQYSKAKLLWATLILFAPTFIFVPCAFADGLRLNARNVASGNGHGAVCITDIIGNIECVEYGIYDPPDSNGDKSNALVRDFRAMPLNIDLNENGNLTASSMQIVLTVFADYYGIDTVEVSHFEEANNLSNAKTKISQINSGIEKGQKYNLFFRNCGEIAGEILAAAGAKNVAFGIRPNSVSKKEIQTITNTKGMTLSGVWTRDATKVWRLASIN